MVAFTSDIQWDVIQSLQSLCNVHSPGSKQFEECDKAISLALSPDRMVNQYLERNVRRDARRSLERTSRDICFSDFCSTSRESGFSGDSGYSIISVPTREASPEEYLIAKELLGVVYSAISQIKHGKECLNGLLSGETVKETASRIGITRHKVEYAKRNIRCVTQKLIEEGII